ncbi:MAG: hypothetical protein KL787_08700 [Taibaiella sp.]|nr:hypothetical protein [Taibaiella sp.]
MDGLGQDPSPAAATGPIAGTSSPQHAPGLLPASPSPVHSKEKMGPGFLERLKEKTRQNSGQSDPVKELDAAALQHYIDEYALELEQEGKDLVKTQLRQCKFKLEDPLTIQCTTHMHLQYNTLNSIRNDLADFISAKVHNPKLKVRITLEESENTGILDRVLTKNEIFDQMAARFPILQTLKDQLHLTVKAHYVYEQARQEEEEYEPENNVKLEENAGADADQDILEDE